MDTKHEDAKKIMGNDFFSQKEIKKAFGVRLDLENIPPIPFPIASLKKAKNDNQFLILRIDKINNRELLTIEKMHSLLNGKLSDGSFALFSDYNASGERNNDALYKDEAFATKETPELSWALVDKNISRDLNNHPRLRPVEIIYDYIVYFQNTGKKLLQHADILTSCTHDNMTIFISDFPKEDGLYIGLTKEGRQNPRLANYVSITKL